VECLGKSNGLNISARVQSSFVILFMIVIGVNARSNDRDECEPFNPLGPKFSFKF
jgi:hypothetical protein